MKKIKIKKRSKKTPIEDNKTISQFKKTFKKGNLAEKILIIIMLFLVVGFALALVFFAYVVIF